MSGIRNLVCRDCGSEMVGVSLHQKYCSQKCKRRYHKKRSVDQNGPVSSHTCRMCGTGFPIGKGQNNQWLCSEKCRRASNAKSVREFHKRRPLQQELYRARTRKKIGPDGNLIRFYGNNPNAPRSCESCGEIRVLEIAHKPGFERIGERRSKVNSKWPDLVWVLCPTCHRLLDRMGYAPGELGL